MHYSYSYLPDVDFDSGRQNDGNRCPRGVTKEIEQNLHEAERGQISLLEKDYIGFSLVYVAL